MEHDGEGNTNSIWCARNNPKKLGKRTVRIRDNPHYSINKIGQDNEKNPGDLMRLAVAQTPENGRLLLLA